MQPSPKYLVGLLAATLLLGAVHALAGEPSTATGATVYVHGNLCDVVPGIYHNGTPPPGLTPVAVNNDTSVALGCRGCVSGWDETRLKPRGNVSVCAFVFTGSAWGTFDNTIDSNGWYAACRSCVCVCARACAPFIAPILVERLTLDLPRAGRILT